MGETSPDPGNSRMFSRWEFSRSSVVKRVCKFLLKKKLGEVILGDIDLDQLDVQLSTGTIHLTDLALNVDFLNQKVSGMPIVIKEGSLKSLSIRIPWKLRNCEIEINEIELVLEPFRGNNISLADAKCKLAHDGQQYMKTNSDKIELGPAQYYHGSIPLDVHEGVKTIAKIVKWFLTSFHVKLNGIIVAFDPCLDLDERRNRSHELLVFRVKETEFGTCVSEDSMAKLTNFVKFCEANIEFLLIDDIDKGIELHSVTGKSFNERFLRHGTTPILTGASGGFSGTLNLSIPWKNGYLDIHKVDADVSIDPMELRVQPSSIEWLIATWHSLKNIRESQWTYNHKRPDSFKFSCKSGNHSSMSCTVYLDADAETPVKANEVRSVYSAITPEVVPNMLLMRTNVIHNWIPEYVYHEDQSDVEPDLGASIDQFFECFDELRSSQVYPASGHIWNWTCSVFNAISVASNLASGMGDIPKEQHVETSLRAAIAGISVILFLRDDDQQSSYGSNKLLSELSFGSYMSCHSPTNVDVSSTTEVDPVNEKMHHLEAKCQNVVLDLEQTYSQNTKFSASVEHIKVDAYYDTQNCATGISSHEWKNESKEQMFLSPYLQEKVQDALPPFPFHIRNRVSESAVRDKVLNGLNQVRLLETFGECSCKLNVNSKDSHGVALTSFVIELPPFVLWFHYALVYMLLDLFRRIKCPSKKYNINKDVQSDMLSERERISFHEVAENCIHHDVTSVSPRAFLQGNIVLPQARIIIWFPSEYYGDFSNSTFLDKIITLEHSATLNSEEASDAFTVPEASSGSDQSHTPSSSIHSSIRNFYIYLVESSKENALDVTISTLNSQLFTAVKILSVEGTKKYSCSGVTMLWQKGPVTGRWMADRAWSLSASHDQNRNKIIGKESEFSSVTNVEDLEETGSNVRQELILSSAFLLQIQLSRVCIDLDNHDFKLLNCLLNNLIDGYSEAAIGVDVCVDSSIKNKFLSSSNASQTTILVKCDVLDASIRLNEVIEVNHLVQKELQGSWNYFKLKVDKFELLSVSNTGGVGDAKFLWLNHGEGELWGSIISNVEKSRAVAEEFLLLTCRNSAMRRGNGEGANALMFGPAGTAVTNMWNPLSQQSYTSIMVRCGTVIAPGGRLDWISDIFSYFSSSPREKGNDGTAGKLSFFLDLVDVALSYEPHNKQSAVSTEDRDCEHDSDVEPDKETEKVCTACLLAAASLSLSHHTKSDTTFDYNIHLKDVGFLICESTGSLHDIGGYCVGYLQKAGYCKVAQVSFLLAILRIRGMFWEIECTDSHIDLESCHDTTFGLFRLVSQLQQLYAPDVEDALIHLQSRWNAIQLVDKDRNTSYIAEVISSNSAGSGFELSTSSEEHQAAGLLDEILENAFECHTTSDHCGTQSHISLKQCQLGDMLNVNASRADDAFAANILDSGSSCSAELGQTLNQPINRTYTSQVIESYYASDMLPSSPVPVSNCSFSKDSKCIDTSSHKDTEHRQGGWYLDDGLMILEDHISTNLNQPEGKSLQQEGEFGADNFYPVDCCLLNGRVVLKNMNARWCMYAGHDWTKPKGLPVCSVTQNGRDRSTFLELSLVGLYLQYDIYPEGVTYVSKFSLSIQDVQIYDRSSDAPWKMVLGNYQPKDYLRESHAKAFKLILEAVRPNPLTPLEEYRLHIELLPLRLHLDQTHLNFLISFFGKDLFNDTSPVPPNNLDESDMSKTSSRRFGSQTMVEVALLPFFQKCDVRPVVVRVDYIPRHCDAAALRRGNYAELLNLVPWKGIDLQLKHVCATGIYGWSNICETVVGEWLEDIAHNQIRNLLKGLPPIKSLSAVSSGTKKLVSLPVKSYKKEHKFLTGMQRGAMSFIKSISIEAVGLGLHLAAGAHEILLQTEDFLTSIPMSVPLSEIKRKKANVRSNQPENAQEGIQQAYESLSDGFGRTTSALLVTPLKAYQRGAGTGSVLATAIRGTPAAAIAPLSASARAVHWTLLGLRNRSLKIFVND
ncbi:autophagy-related protein 2-like isoform X3 [Musa acuminata AAA Group]|uniref:autophagy-related protein 2-like isoform X3 n=2 Tax=Musa acuminata AAA Group TaxID=214697 RepID=UPI0031DB24BB